MSDPKTEATTLLQRWRAGDAEARDALFERCYQEMRQSARMLLARDAMGQQLRPTELVNESAMRLLNLDAIDWQDRAHFLAMAARVMRQTLIDQARRQRAIKRDAVMTVLGTGLFADEPDIDVSALHDALERLAQISPQRAQIVELRFFGGLTMDEIGAALGISERTAKRGWRAARAWLLDALGAAEAGHAGHA